METSSTTNQPIRVWFTPKPLPCSWFRAVSRGVHWILLTPVLPKSGGLRGSRVSRVKPRMSIRIQRSLKKRKTTTKKKMLLVTNVKACCRNWFENLLDQKTRTLACGFLQRRAGLCAVRPDLVVLEQPSELFTATSPPLPNFKNGYRRKKNTNPIATSTTVQEKKKKKVYPTVLNS